LPTVPVEISVEAVEGVISLSAPALYVLPSTGKGNEDGVRESTDTEESERRNHETQRKTTNLEDAPCGTTVNPQRLVQHLVERSVVVRKRSVRNHFLLNFGCAAGPRMLPLLLQIYQGMLSLRRKHAPAPAPDALRGHPKLEGRHATTRPRHHQLGPSVAPPSPLTTSAPVGGSGASAGRLTHWSQPGGGTSSSGISTTAARLSSIGDGAGGPTAR
jgi:hypothetical protein